MYLLDTNVVSELRRARPNPHVLSWLKSVDPRSVRLSVFVVGELRKGVAELARTSAERAEEIHLWLDQLIEEFAPSIVQFALADAIAWGRLTAHERAPEVDSFLAAQALTRDWVVVTRNVRDFERTGVRVLDPFDPPPSPSRRRR
jgi:predicted nucleic acid-binding protein